MDQSIEPRADTPDLAPSNEPTGPRTLSEPGETKPADSSEVGANAVSGSKEAEDPCLPASVSSLLSSDSTSKLINSLSINGVKEEQGQVRTITKKYEEYSGSKLELAPTPNKPESKGNGEDTRVSSRLEESASSPDRESPKEAPQETLSNGPVKSNIVVSPVLPKVVSKPVAAEPVSKKPIKFTVRKVSREEEVKPKRVEAQKEYLYGNIPEHRAKLELRKATDKKSQLQQSQQKYDLYVVRLDKIEKEIRFLANLLPPYNVEIDYATRNKITRAIEKLRMKKDEIDKKKYSLGISISRLWREYDENTTWVRSVSNQ